MARIFKYSHRVTYADCTAGNHVYYARYLDFLESARGEFFREIGFPFLQLQEQGTIFPVVECRLRYRRPARYDDVVTVEIWPAVAERVRLNFGYSITLDADEILLAETCHVCTDLDGKLQRLPPDLAAKLQPLLRPPIAT
ncbi:MAG TPA: thioesterase family protein [Verrucomicrobiae bacterium]|nr:thioesterase family protein [Verrucomicrobiae bacterium]